MTLWSDVDRDYLHGNQGSRSNDAAGDAERPSVILWNTKSVIDAQSATRRDDPLQYLFLTMLAFE